MIAMFLVLSLFTEGFECKGEMTCMNNNVARCRVSYNVPQYRCMIQSNELKIICKVIDSDGRVVSKNEDDCYGLGWMDRDQDGWDFIDDNDLYCPVWRQVCELPS